jgi:LysM repeat protein
LTFDTISALPLTSGKGRNYHLTPKLSMMEFHMSYKQPIIRTWLFVFILLVSLAGFPAKAQGTTVVRVEPASKTAQVGETFNLIVKVDNISNLAAIELHLSFNPAVLEVTGLSNGGFIAADFTAQNTFDNGAGTIDFAIAQMNRAPAQGSGTLLNVSFRAKANGSSTLTTRATQATPSGFLLADQNGTAIQASWAPGTITVGTSTVTNTPTSTSTPTPTNTSNSPVVTNTPTKTSTPQPPSGLSGTHIVRSGEWLYCIARAYRVSPTAIVEANYLWWPYLIFPNQVLTIPNVPWTNMTSGPVCQTQFTFPTSPTPTATPNPGTTPPPTTCRAVYTVQPGDTLYRIGVRHGVSYTEIARVNGIANPALIYPGQQLCIP